MTGIIELVPMPKSHHFDQRRIKVGPESEPVKIGRAVARVQPSKENAVFDCKVLSRNHAIIWYKDGDFFLQDTKSSNGTFVNNEKLIATNNHCESRKIYSGDIIQLGVEISESSNQVAYGCIYAVIQCFDENGMLIRHKPMNGGDYTEDTLDNSHKMFKMQRYISDGIFREKVRDEKIIELYAVLEELEQVAASSWKALVNEDRLLARIESLEAQLEVFTSNSTPEKMNLVKVLDDKAAFESQTKEIIRRLNEELAETRSRLKDIERSLDATENTCNQLRATNEEYEMVMNDTTLLCDTRSDELKKVKMDLAEKEVLMNDFQKAFDQLTSEYFELSNSPNELFLKLKENVRELSDENMESFIKLGRELTVGESAKSEHESGNAETYLKEILLLQARIREMDDELMLYKRCSSSSVEMKNGKMLEMTQPSNMSIEPPTVRLNTSNCEQTSLLLSMVPFLVFLLTLILPIHNKLGSCLNRKEVEEKGKQE